MSFISRFFTRSFALGPKMSIAPEGGSGAASSAATAIPEGAQLCTVAAGCFWGTEHLYRRHFAGKGLLDAKVGYIGGDLTDPSYRAVCGGKTGRKFLLLPRFRSTFSRIHHPTPVEPSSLSFLFPPITGIVR